MVVVAGTQLRLFDPVQSSTGVSVVTGDAEMVVVEVGTQLLCASYCDSKYVCCNFK